VSVRTRPCRTRHGIESVTLGQGQRRQGKRPSARCRGSPGHEATPLTRAATTGQNWSCSAACFSLYCSVCPRGQPIAWSCARRKTSGWRPALRRVSRLLLTAPTARTISGTRDIEPAPLSLNRSGGRSFTTRSSRASHASTGSTPHVVETDPSVRRDTGLITCTVFLS